MPIITGPNVRILWLIQYDLHRIGRESFQELIRVGVENDVEKMTRECLYSTNQHFFPVKSNLHIHIISAEQAGPF